MQIKKSGEMGTSANVLCRDGAATVKERAGTTFTTGRQARSPIRLFFATVYCRIPGGGMQIKKSGEMGTSANVLCRDGAATVKERAGTTFTTGRQASSGSGQ